MSAKCTYLAWETCVSDEYKKIVMLQLADKSDDDGYSRPSYKSIAKACDLSVDTVSGVLNQLSGEGVIEFVSDGGVVFIPAKPGRGR